MKIRKLHICILLVTVITAGPVLASEEFCIKFQDIEGSGDACGLNGSQAWEYHHLAAREVVNGVPGALRHHQIIVTKRADDAENLLWQRLDSGELIPEVIIESPVGSPNRVRFRLTLTNARILGLEPIIPHVHDPDSGTFGDQTRIRMDYQSLTLSYGPAEPYVITP